MIAFLILGGLVIGLWLGRWPWYIALIVVLISFIYTGHRYRYKGCLILLSCLVLGGGLSLLDSISPPNQEQYQGIVISSKENYFLFYSGGHRYYVYAEDSSQELGDILKIEGTIRQIDFTTYESRFNFESYLHDKGVRFELYAHSVETIFANPLRISERKKAFLNHFDESSASLLDALLFSTRNNENELIQNASSMNLIFLFSMCGVYLRSVMAFLEYLLKLKLSDKTARVITVIAVTPLLALSFEKLAVQRLLLIYGLRIANDYLFKTKMSYCSLTAFVGLGFLCCDYHVAYQMSFLMGFGLSFLMIFLRLPIRVLPRRIRKIAFMVMVFVFLIPIHIAMTHELHLFQIVFQCLAIPLNTVYFVIGAVSFYTIPFSEFISLLTRIISGVFAFLARYDVKITVGEVPILFHFVYYGLFLALLYFIEGHRIAVSKKITTSMFLLLSIASVPVRNVFVEAIHFINVGQGDAILIQSRETNILIDTGGNLGFDMAKEVLIPFFRKKMVRKIDYLITTHDDFDHNGAVSSLINLFPVKNQINSGGSFPLVLERLQIENINTANHEDSNDNSLVLSFDFINRSWLLMGDASINVEREIMTAYPSLDVDMLKVGHHGSRTSTSDAFISQITPDEAIISVGAKNYYNHPNDEVLAILSRHQVIIRRTDLEGTISYYRCGF